ncbi:MAG: prepilin peptidase [Planctomycetes bacterium]|nr:prepilin peptidase [Planctomycetota bacterium]
MADNACWKAVILAARAKLFKPNAESHLNATFATDLITALWLGFTGACIGSFLNVVAYRMPLGMSVVWKPSHCPKCSHPIRAYDNVPVLGWLWLRGKCRDCGEPISPRYAIVEFVMGLTFFVLAYVELFSGGANLPGGPITEFTGAVGNVWVPQWELILWYGGHGLLLCFLMCLILMSIDAKRSKFRLGLLVSVWLAMFLVISFWKQVVAW